MCSTFCAAFAHAAGPYGVSESGPIQNHVLEALCRKLVFPIRSHDPDAIPSIVLFRFRRLAVAGDLSVGRRSPVDLSCAHQGPDDPRHLVGQSHANQQWRLALDQAIKPGICSPPISSAPHDDTVGADNQQSSERAFPHLCRCTEALLAPC